MITKEKAIESAHVVLEWCYEHNSCEGCPFDTKNYPDECVGTILESVKEFHEKS